VSNSEEQSRSKLSAFDLIAEDLQRLRLDAGDVPYAEIVRRIASHRISQGADPGASRPARSTVYDAFRAGRTRLNVELISEIVRALGGTDEDVEKWRDRCLRARADRVTYVAESATHPNSQSLDTVERPGITQVEDSTQSEEPRRGRRPSRRMLLIASSIAINLLGFWLVATLGIPLYLDMLGTAIVAMVLGPWAAVAVAIATNLVGSSITDFFFAGIHFGQCHRCLDMGIRIPVGAPWRKSETVLSADVFCRAVLQHGGNNYIVLCFSWWNRSCLRINPGKFGFLWNAVDCDRIRVESPLFSSR